MKNSTFNLSLLCASFCLTGCSTLQVASLATIAFTGKGFSDHALSAATGQDCNFFNIIQGERVCYFDNSTEMMLLTSNQVIDDSLQVDYLRENSDPDSYLVIGSFSDQLRAESYQSEYMQWDSRVVSFDTKYRVVVGPVDHQDRDSIKRTLVNEGIESPWLITL